MDLRNTVCLLFALICVNLFLPTNCFAARLPVHTDDSNLQNIIIELENVVYKLKDYVREGVESGSSKSDRKNDAEAELQGSLASDKSSPIANKQITDGNDISLKDALEYLITLAKQQKQEKRDHDIPFPIQSEHN